MNQRDYKKTTRRAAGRLTPPQVAILVIVTLLGGAAIFFGARLLLAPQEAVPTLAATSPTVAQGAVSPQPTRAADATPTAPNLVQLPGLPATCALGSSPASQGVVTGVAKDGTLEVQMGSSTVKVTYAGIEMLPANPGDYPAQRAAQAMLEGRPVLLVRDATDVDAKGRLVRYVFSAEDFVNSELVRQGLAAARPQSDDRACAIYLLEAEQQARSAGLGGWKITPIPTNTFIPFVEIETSSACDCFRRPECSEFRTHEEAQACYNACNDYNSRLDSDRDGLACEELP